jgi:hypothetical protein
MVVPPRRGGNTLIPVDGDNCQNITEWVRHEPGLATGAPVLVVCVAGYYLDGR